MRNPFRYGAVVSGESFCGREDAILELTNFITIGQNVVLQGERRIGKTSLVCETVRHLKNRLLQVNFMEVKSTDEACKRILHALLALERSGSRFDRLMKSLAHLRPIMSLNPITGEPSVSFDSMSQLNPDSITDIIALIGKAHAVKPLVVFFDEFQDILKIENPHIVLVQLRSVIQHQPNVPYLYAGSIRNRMDEIFNHPDSAFFKSALIQTVGPLILSDFTAFIETKFKAGNRSIDPQCLQQIFYIAAEITGDIQQLCEALWSVTDNGDHISETTLSTALNLIFSREQKTYEIILTRLSAGYVRMLKALAKLDGKQVASSAFVREAAASNASAVASGLKRMSGQKIVFNDGEQWRFTNPFFRAWLLDRESL